MDDARLRYATADETIVLDGGRRASELLHAYYRGDRTIEQLVAELEQIPRPNLTADVALALSQRYGPLAVVKQEETSGRLPLGVVDVVVSALIGDSETRTETLLEQFRRAERGDNDVEFEKADIVSPEVDLGE